MITAPAPPRWSAKTRYASSFVAYLAVSKCRGSMPFYRLESLAKSATAPIARSTMNERSRYANRRPSASRSA